MGVLLSLFYELMTVEALVKCVSVKLLLLTIPHVPAGKVMLLQKYMYSLPSEQKLITLSLKMLQVIYHQYIVTPLLGIKPNQPLRALLMLENFRMEVFL